MENTNLQNLVIENLNKRDTTPIYADTESFLCALRNLLNMGEITLEQYAISLRRANHCPKALIPLDTSFPLESPMTSRGLNLISQKAMDHPQRLEFKEGLCTNFYSRFSGASHSQEAIISKKKIKYPLLNNQLLGKNLFKELRVDYVEY